MFISRKRFDELIREAKEEVYREENMRIQIREIDDRLSRLERKVDKIQYNVEDE